MQQDHRREMASPTGLGQHGLERPIRHARTGNLGNKYADILGTSRDRQKKGGCNGQSAQHLWHQSFCDMTSGAAPWAILWRGAQATKSACLGLARPAGRASIG
jgi:hypothetical protein